MPFRVDSIVSLVCVSACVQFWSPPLKPQKTHPGVVPSSAAEIQLLWISPPRPGPVCLLMMLFPEASIQTTSDTKLRETTDEHPKHDQPRTTMRWMNRQGTTYIYAHLDVPVDDSSSVERPQASQDLLEQLCPDGGRYSTAHRSNQGVSITPPRPVEHHGCGAEGGGGNFDRRIGATTFLEKGRVDEDVAEPHEVAEVYLVVTIDAVGVQAVVQPEASDQLHVRPCRGGVVASFVEELYGDLFVWWLKTKIDKVEAGDIRGRRCGW